MIRTSYRPVSYTHLVDELDDLEEKLNDLTDASDKLVDGSDDLYDNLKLFDSKMGAVSYTHLKDPCWSFSAGFLSLLGSWKDIYLKAGQWHR